MKNALAFAFVVLTQAACASFYSMEPPPSFGATYRSYYGHDIAAERDRRFMLLDGNQRGY